MTASYDWAFPRGDGGYDMNVEAFVEGGEVRFVVETRNPIYGGRDHAGTFTFAELLEQGPPDPLSRELCAELLEDVAAALAEGRADVTRRRQRR